jgi:hypothetical protein
MRAFRFLGLALIGLAAMVPQAKAVLLPPDGSLQTLGAPISPPAGSIIASQVDPFTNTVGSKTLSGQLFTAVFRLSTASVQDGVTYQAGDLVFIYATGLAGGNQKATGLGLGGYTAGTPYDAQLVTLGGTGPKFVSYDSSVSTITAQFSPSLPANKLSDFLLIFTTATKFTTDFASVLGTSGTSASALPIFVPFTATPEPGTIALACAGLPVLGLYALRRRRRAKSA